MFKTCLQLVYNLFMTCSWLDHYLFIILFMTCLWLVHDLFMTCSWLVHKLVNDLFMSFLQLVNVLFLICSWLVNDLFTTCSQLVHATHQWTLLQQIELWHYGVRKYLEPTWESWWQCEKNDVDDKGGLKETSSFTKLGNACQNFQSIWWICFKFTRED